MIEEWEFDDVKTSIRIFTKRDLNILHDLYNYRVLTVQQVLHRYFGGQKYGYHRMYMLRKDGLVSGGPVVSHGEKGRTSCYYITDKGIRLLLREGIIEKPVRLAKHIRVEGPQIYYLLDVNDIFLELRDWGWVPLSGNDVKRHYKLNRADMIQGMLTDMSGKRYGVYLVSREPEELAVSKVVSDIRKSPIHSSLIFCKGEAGYKLVRRMANEMNTLVGGSFNVLPYNNGVRILKSLRSTGHVINLYKRYGNNVRRDEHGRRFSHLIDHNGEEKYIGQLLTGDLMTRFQLARYHRDDYLREGRKVLVLAWSGQREEIEQAYEAYPHIEFEWLGMDVLDTLSD